ncbi:MAG TPA: radical SAM protein [Myxococcota bacterium]|nr:radical SAM protein [Myxococcota bacterium]
MKPHSDQRRARSGGRSRSRARPPDLPTVVLVKPPLRVPRASYTTLACPPISLACLAAVLRRASFPVTVVDAVGEAPTRLAPMANPKYLRVGLSDDEIVRRIPPDARLIGFTSMFSEEWPLVREVVASVRRAFPDALLVLGGEHATAAPEACLADAAAIDLCVLGEGEATLLDLAHRVARGEDVGDVPGTAVREGAACRRNPARPRIRDLDALPMPAWDLLPLENYLSHGLGFGLNRGPSVPLVISRGCPYDCAFCSASRMWGRRWLVRSPDNVLAEMEAMILRYGARNFDIYDLTAIQRKDWIVEFCTKLIAKGWNISWQIPAGTRSEVIAGDIPDLLYRSGCRYLAYAPESGSEAVLRRVRKRLSMPGMKRSMRDALDAGVHIKCNMIIGFPEETPRDYLDTVRLCVELALLGVHDVNIGPFCPYPGSDLFAQLAAQGRIDRLDNAFFDKLASYSDLGRTESWAERFSSRELAAMRWAAMAAFYGTSFATRPWRLAGVIRDVATGRHNTRLARALGDILQRYRRTLASRLSGGDGAG